MSDKKNPRNEYTFQQAANEKEEALRASIDMNPRIAPDAKKIITDMAPQQKRGEQSDK